MSTEENLGENSGTASNTNETVAAASADIEQPSSPTLTKTKIDVLLKAAGDAPIMKKKKWTVDRNKKVAYITAFISKAIKLEPGESLFLYVNQSFAPPLDTEVGTVFDVKM
ncbi:ATG12-like protein [Mya arenaria]|uniref:Ubiquitin-like protein ATG12 n=1 Tax=Mya arenaria TaxID=6604 RepID=A0ABY7ET44_MYAAR|nr:ATG12-like protein [Mya arenaria]